MKNKKLFIAVLFLILTVSFSACNRAEDHKNNDLQSQTPASSTTDASAGTDDTPTQTDGEQTTVHTHSAKSVKENEVAPTCEAAGSYDRVVYCSECREELSRTTISVAKLSHSYKNGICIRCNAQKTSKGLKFTSNGDGTCSLTGIGSCTDNDIIIPSVSPSGDRVTAISAQAFYSCSELDSVRMPDSVTSIGEDAFYYCTFLQTVVLSNNITSLGDGIFSGCINLQYNQLDGFSYIGSEQNPYLVLVEANDKTKTEYEVNEKTVFISNHAFASCSNATNFVIGDQVVSIGSCAFQRCSSLVSITLPQNLTKISGQLFSNCDALESIVIPSKVTVIELLAFSFCKNLKSVELPEGLKKIESSAFNFCSALTEISIPNTVTEIQHGAFRDCSMLSGVVLPNSITVIPDSLFTNCSSLKSITIPSGVTKIGKHAFAGCASLESITIPSGVTEIGTQAFENCTALESIVIPAAVKKIGDNAFRNCSKLKNIQFEITDGWQCFDVNTPMTDFLDLSDTEQNATYLTLKYNRYTWKRK